MCRPKDNIHLTCLNVKGGVGFDFVAKIRDNPKQEPSTSNTNYTRVMQIFSKRFKGFITFWVKNAKKILSSHSFHSTTIQKISKLKNAYLVR